VYGVVETLKWFVKDINVLDLGFAMLGIAAGYSEGSAVAKDLRGVAGMFIGQTVHLPPFCSVMC